MLIYCILEAENFKEVRQILEKVSDNKEINDEVDEITA